MVELGRGGPERKTFNTTHTATMNAPAPRLSLNMDDKRGDAKRGQAAPRLCLEYGRHERSGGTEACMQPLNSYG